MLKLTYVSDVITDPNSCLSLFYSDVALVKSNPSAATDDGVADLTSNDVAAFADLTYITSYYTPSYYNLQPQLYLYWEQKLYPEQVSFKPAMNLECSSPGLLFPEELKH